MWLFQGPGRSEGGYSSPQCETLQTRSFTVSCLASVPSEAQVVGTQGLLRFGAKIWRPHPGVDHTPLSKPGRGYSLPGGCGTCWQRAGLKCIPQLILFTRSLLGPPGHPPCPLPLPQTRGREELNGENAPARLACRQDNVGELSSSQAMPAGQVVLMV